MSEISDLMTKLYPYFLIILILCVLFLIYWFKSIIFNIGFKLINKGEYKKAIDKFRLQLKKNPRKGTSYYGIGLCYYMMGNNEFAIKNFQSSIVFKFREVESYFLMAILYSEEKQFDKALESIEIGKKIQKKKTIINKLTAFQISEMIGWFYYKKNDIKTALDYYEKAIPGWNKYFKKIKAFTLGEKFSPVYYRIGIILKIMGESAKANEYFENSIKSSPNSIFAEKSKIELTKIID